MHPIDRAVAEANERIRTCHERVSCPQGGAAVGVGCSNLSTGAPTKHPHRERWTLVQPAR
jgi:hypothetical protein